VKKTWSFVLTVAALVVVLAWICQVQAYEVTGDVTPGWGQTGGNLWSGVLKETATSSAGGYDDTQPYQRGVIVRPLTTASSPNPINPTNHNWIDGDYVLVTGRSGHRALYAIGELDPRFGNKTVNVTLNKDKKEYDLAGAGREVKKVVTIDVVHAVDNIKGVSGDQHPYSQELVVSGAGIKPKKYTLADLQAMQQVIFDASAVDPKTNNTYGIWKGPALVGVLKASGIDTNNVDSYIVVTATDGYATVVSMYEATHPTGAQYALLAISDTLNNTVNCSLNGGTCAKKDSGFVRFVLPNDLAAGRWISNAYQIIVYKLDREKGYHEPHRH